MTGSRLLQLTTKKVYRNSDTLELGAVKRRERRAPLITAR